jgi:hypothetical protein
MLPTEAAYSGSGDSGRGGSCGVGVSHRSRQHVGSGLVAGIANEGGSLHSSSGQMRDGRDINHATAALWAWRFYRLMRGHFLTRAWFLTVKNSEAVRGVQRISAKVKLLGIALQNRPVPAYS